MKRRPPAKRPPAAPPDVKQAVDLIKRAQRGDRDAVPGLCDFLDHHPRAPALVASMGDLEEFALGRLAGDWHEIPNLLAPEVWGRKAETMRQELAGDHPTPLERLLVGRIVYCHFALYRAELGAIAAETHRGGLYCDRIVDGCHRRLLSACRALDRLRRLDLPPSLAVQVNVESPPAPRDLPQCTRGQKGTDV
jgi:hypothetical protein